jgi:hypothetical protein
MIIQGPLAQSVEQQTFNLWVVGSIPTGPTHRLNRQFMKQIFDQWPSGGAFRHGLALFSVAKLLACPICPNITTITGYLRRCVQRQ